jgi:hypothetical protein
MIGTREISPQASVRPFSGTMRKKTICVLSISETVSILVAVGVMVGVGGTVGVGVTVRVGAEVGVGLEVGRVLEAGVGLEAGLSGAVNSEGVFTDALAVGVGAIAYAALKEREILST